MLFFVAFEFVLVPMYFLIVGWGHGNKVYAATKFFLYTMAGSAFLFVGILTRRVPVPPRRPPAHVRRAHPHRVERRRRATSRRACREALFLAFCVAFAVKVPLFPLHTWLPDAHTEAPTAGSVVLAGVLLKMGTYGFLRFAIPMFPQAAVDLAPILLVVGGDRHRLRRDRRGDATRPEATHRVLVDRAPRASWCSAPSRSPRRASRAALFTMVSHGLTTGALFLLVGMLYDRRHTRLIADFGGLWKAVPILGGLFIAATFASIGLPGFSGFVGEFLALLGTFLTHRWYAVVATTGVIFAAVYLLWAVPARVHG